ncbi:MAG: twin-arginine translocase TatA/TatE family subunit [Paludibacteraceae bacterium]
MTLLMIGSSEIIFIVILVILLFGGKKIPELMRGLGKGVRSFKEGMNGTDEQPNQSQNSDFHQKHEEPQENPSNKERVESHKNEKQQ